MFINLVTEYFYIMNQQSDKSVPNPCVAIMQPYVFPYIGYMNLVYAADTFVFLDDVNFIKKGWVNRNQIVLNGDAYTFTVPLSGASQNKLIMDIRAHNIEKFALKFLHQLSLSYKNAKFYNQGMSYVESTLLSNNNHISHLAINSVKNFYEYINVNKTFLKSSEIFAHTQHQGKSERLIAITKDLNSSHYINAYGGIELYSKREFRDNGVNLNFLKPNFQPYEQCNTKSFLYGLSIIDLVMNLSRDEIIHHMQNYVIL